MSSFRSLWCVTAALAMFALECHAETEQTAPQPPNKQADDIVAEEVREDAISWMQKNAVRLKSMTAGSGFEDMQPIAEMIGDAKIVGLGEASHGTREFFQFKHRMLEYLVENHGFRLFGIEANFPDCIPLSNYVTTGEGDPEALVHGMRFWTWDTEEVLELVKWMRSYNESHEEKLIFFGFDAQYAPPALQLALDFIRPLNVDKHAHFHEALEAYLPGDKSYSESAEHIFGESAEQKNLRHENALELLQFFDRNESRFVKAKGEKAYGLARTAAFTAERAFAMYRPEEGEEASLAGLRSFNTRDQAMADIALWALDHYGVNQKAVLWAHNAHVQSSAFIWDGREARVMGLNLAAALGDQYLNLGFGFAEGGLQARGAPSELETPGADNKRQELPPLQEFIAPPAPANTIGGTMRDTGLGDFLIDLRALSLDGGGTSWFTTSQAMRLPGAVYLEEPVEKWPRVTLSGSFDLFVFVEKTTRARPLERTRKRFGITKTWER